MFRDRINKARQDTYDKLNNAYFNANYKRNCEKWGLDEFDKDGKRVVQRNSEGWLHL